jgi:spore coat polysaccharide biosynthesis predicted glycosyltransferase SpsG
LLLLDKKGNSLPVTGNFKLVHWLSNSRILKTYTHFNIVLIDSYLLNKEEEAFIKNLFSKTVFLDDYNRMTFLADLVINPNVCFGLIDYSNQKKVIGGKNYVILRKEFRNYNTEFNSGDNKILVTIGGTDFRNILADICEKVISAGFDDITVICPDKRDLIKLGHLRQDLQIKEFLSASEMITEYNKASIVISGCGSTLNELASMGKFTVGICLDVDQEPVQNFYLKEGLLLTKICWDDENMEDKILSNINLLLNNTDHKRYFEKAVSLINKKGVENIVSQIFSIN